MRETRLLSLMYRLQSGVSGSLPAGTAVPQ